MSDETFMYDMAKLKIFDRDPVKYRQEHASVTSQAERIRPMFTNGAFNRNTFNQVFEHFKKPESGSVPVPVAMLSSKMPTYGYAMDGGQTMLKSDSEINGSTQYTNAYNSHANPDDYSESLLEKCKSKSRKDKENPLNQAEIQNRLSQRGQNINIPKGSKPDFTKPVENNSMIQEEEAPAKPVILDYSIQLPQRGPVNFNQPPQQLNYNQPPQQLNYNQPPQQLNFNQPPQQLNYNQPLNFNQPPQQLNFNPPLNFNQPPPQLNFNQPQFMNQPTQPQLVQILPIDQKVQEAPKKTRRPQPPIYNRSSLTKPKTEPEPPSDSEIAELKKLIRKQEEQLRLLTKKLKDY